MAKDENQTEERVMLITGSSRGIGAHLADHYVKQGYRVVGCSTKPIETDRPNYEHFSLDITDEAEVIALFSAIKKKYKRLDVLINNAGIATLSPAVLTPYDVVHDILNVNVAGAFLFCREAARLMMRKKYGRIVNLSSTASPLKIESEAIYAASKAALEKLTQVLAKEFAPFNVTVNALGPTIVKTDMGDAIPEEMVEKVLAMQAVKRVGVLEDVSNAMDFLVSPKSDFITGQIVYLGGV